jgi:hypothetical protein
VITQDDVEMKPPDNLSRALNIFTDDQNLEYKAPSDMKIFEENRACDSKGHLNQSPAEVITLIRPPIQLVPPESENVSDLQAPFQ